MIAEIHLEQIQKQIFFYEHVVAFTRNTINESLDCLKKNLGVWRCYVYLARLNVAMTKKQTR